MGPTETTNAYWAQHDSTATGLVYQHPDGRAGPGLTRPPALPHTTSGKPGNHRRGDWGLGGVCRSGHRRVWADGGPKSLRYQSRETYGRAPRVRHGTCRVNRGKTGSGYPGGNSWPPRECYEPEDPVGLLGVRGSGRAVCTGGLFRGV